MQSLFESSRGDVEMECCSDTAEEGTEVTFGNDVEGGSMVEEMTTARKRKANGQDDLQRRSEIRLMGNASRLDRISGSEISHSGAALPNLHPAGETPRSKQFPERPVNAAKSVPVIRSTDERYFERRFSCLSLTKSVGANQR